MDDPTISLFEEWTRFSHTQPANKPDVARRISQRFVARVSSDIVKTFDAGETALSKLGASGASIIGQNNARPIFVEIARWARESRSIDIAVSEALANSVTKRRGASRRIDLDLVVIVTPESSASLVSEQEVIQRSQNLLIDDDQVGYDRVYIGFSGPESRWFRLGVGNFGPSEYDKFLLDISTQGAASEIEDAEAVSRSERDSGIKNVPTILLIGDEWSSSYGGISTFNRTLAIALAARGFDVSMLVASHTSEELRDASDHGVSVHAPVQVPGIDAHASLLTPAPTLDEEFAPDLIIGHGRILGPYAFAAQKVQFPRSKRLHIVHTDAESLEAVKGVEPGGSRMLKADARRQVEYSLASSASLVAGVGPLLTEMITDELRAASPRPKVFELVPGLTEQPDQPLSPPLRAVLLVLGRAEDLESKGLDIAARAARLASLQMDTGRKIDSLTIRGVQPQDEDWVAKRVGSYFDATRLKLRPYTSVAAEVRADLVQATTLLMPSRHEGFGLSAYEAIGVGVPVLVSEESGVGRVILSVDPTSPEVIPATGPEDSMIERWGSAIARNVNDPKAAFARAGELRALLASKYTWDTVAQMIRSHMETTEP